MPFSKVDFLECHEELRVIAYSKLGLNYFQPFRDLSKRQQKLVNGEINNFINNLPNEHFMEEIKSKFNTICTEEIFDENFHKNAAQMIVRKSTAEELKQDDEATRSGIEMFTKTMDEINNPKMSEIISDDK